MSSMIRKLAKCRPHSATLLSNVYSPIASAYRTNYFFVLPEVPSDTAESNPFLRKDSIPPFNDIDAKQVISGFQKLLVNYETEVNSLVEKLDTGKGYEKTFESIFQPIENSFAPLDFAYKTSRHLAFIHPYSKFHIGFSRINKKFTRAKMDGWANEKLFKSLKELQSNKHLLTDSQNRLVERLVMNCMRNGFHLNDADHKICNEINSKIDEQQQLFRDTLNQANQKFGIQISDQKPQNEIPADIKKMSAVDTSKPDKGPWTITADDYVVESYLKYSENRKLRKMLYESFYSRAAKSSTKLQGTTNIEVIKDLINFRKKQANFFGYKNFAEMTIEGKSAQSLENVIDMLEKIKTNVKPVVDEDLKKLESFANKNGNDSPLEGFDIEFWKHRLSIQNLKVDPSQLNLFFPYRKLMNGLFDVCKLLFNVEFCKDESQKDRLWDTNVEVYNVHDENGQHLSTLLIDPFIRPKKIDNIWSYSGRDSSLITNTKPLAYLNMNVRDQGANSTFSFDQVKNVFNEFGNLIQILLARTDFGEFSDFNTVEFDAFDLTNKMFQKLVYEPEIIKMVSAHVQTGEPLPAEILNNLSNAKRNMRSFNLMKQSFLSAFDIESHISDKYWYDSMKDIWPKFMPYKMSKDDYRPCQFVTVFGQNFGCNYYSIIWAEMLAADIYESLTDVGFSNKNKIQDVGIRYRDTFLKNGSTLHVNEIFRQFRGRNPSMDPFIKQFTK